MGRIRLACVNCDRSDFDSITPEQLQQAIASGWEDVREEQTYEEACREYDLDNTPKGRSIFDWWTHLGLCPECAKEAR